MSEQLWIGTKKVKLAGKTLAQLEHLLQLAKNERKNYEHACRNYPEDRRLKYAVPFLQRLDANIHAIDQAIKAL